MCMNLGICCYWSLGGSLISFHVANCNYVHEFGDMLLLQPWGVIDIIIANCNYVHEFEDMLLQPWGVNDNIPYNYKPCLVVL